MRLLARRDMMMTQVPLLVHKMLMIRLLCELLMGEETAISSPAIFPIYDINIWKSLSAFF